MEEEDKSLIRKLAEKIPFVGDIISIVFDILDYFKGKSEKTVIFPENQEEFKKIVPQLENLRRIPDAFKIKELREFYDKYEIITVDNHLGIVSKVASGGTIISKLRESKDHELKNQEINIIPVDESQYFEELKNNPKYTKKTIADAVIYLDEYFRSLLGLAIYVEELYNQKRILDASVIKNDIRERYGEKGVRFCNCYQRGYIERFIVSQFIRQKLDLNDKLHNFLNKPIFFVHNQMRNKEFIRIEDLIKQAIKNKKDYIAVHSLGSAGGLALRIINDVNSEDFGDYEIITLDKNVPKKSGISTKRIRNVSKIWYRAEGIEIYNLIKDII